MDRLLGDFRLGVVVASIAFIYAGFEIFRMRQRARHSQGPERRSIVGIIGSVVVLGLVAAILVPRQQKDAEEKSEQQRRHLDQQQEQLRQLEQRGGTDAYQ